jgi:hypothetical protein
MRIIHKQMAAGRWNELSLMEQLANVGSEVERTMSWKKKGNMEYSNQAFARALELLSFTIDDPKNITRLKEPTRTYEVLVDYFAGENQYGSSDELWHKYFFAFNWAAALERQKKFNKN